jgi:hypothetical protein
VLGEADLVGGVAVLWEAERAGEPPGRIDGEHEDAPAAGGHPCAQSGRDRRLPDAAGASADHDAAAEQHALEH